MPDPSPSSWLSGQLTFHRVLSGLALVAIAGAAAASLLGLCGAAWWGFDLFSHFRVQYLMVLGLGAWMATVVRRYVLLGVALAFVLLNGWMVAPSLAPRSQPREGDSLRVLFVNVHTGNRDTERVARLVRRTNADVVGLMEINDRWRARLRPALASYTHRLEQPRAHVIKSVPQC